MAADPLPKESEAGLFRARLALIGQIEVTIDRLMNLSTVLIEEPMGANPLDDEDYIDASGNVQVQVGALIGTMAYMESEAIEERNGR